VALTPNGSYVLVTNEGDDAVAVIGTVARVTSNGTVTLPAGSRPRGIAAAPDGQTAWVANSGNDTVAVINIATKTVSGAPIALPAGARPDGIAISPDGLLAYVAQRGGDVSIINTASRAIVGTAVDALGPSRIAVGPRGGRAFVTNGGSTSVTSFNPANGAIIGAPIPAGAQPSGIAIAPNGAFAYAAALGSNTVTPIATSNNAASPAIGGFNAPAGVAIAPDGSQGYVTNSGASSVSVFSTAGNSVTGSIGVGTAPTGIAIVPNQSPTASFLVTPSQRVARRRLTFQAGASKDPDGRIATYAWDWGDGKRARGPQARRFHTYRRPGTYVATLTVTDNEGCSTEFVFTGQTASCNGSAVASTSSTIVVVDPNGPALRLAGARRQRLRGRVNVFAMCPREPCAVRARARVVTTIVRLGPDFRRASRSSVARASLAAGTWGKLSTRLSKRVRRRAARILRRGGEVEAKMTVIARDATGSQTLRKRTVKLVLPRSKRGNR